MGIRRREFLSGVAQAGGLGATWTTLQALGLLAPASTAADPPCLPAETGRGRRVAILGAGLAGLVAAYELTRGGFDCIVLEAQAQVGGRCRTLRRGDHFTTLDGRTQTCDFSDGQYFNVGAARLPGTHGAVLAYCRELDVALETEVATNRWALVASPDLGGGAPLTQARVHADTRGHLAALLAAATRRGALDHELSAVDREQLLDFLRAYAGLSADLQYRGREAVPLDLRQLLSTSLWDRLLTEELPTLQPTLLHPVGGMDRLPQAFATWLGSRVRTGAIVETLRREAGGVRVQYRDATSGERRELTADDCICTLPLPVLERLDTDLSPAWRRAISAIPYEDATKLAWEAPRFWEQQGIYGGTSYVSGETAVCWYPSDRWQSPTGILVGAYTMGWAGRHFAGLPFAAQCERSRAAIERLHPGQGRTLRAPIVVSWSQLEYSRGAWALPANATLARGELEALWQPDGPVHLAGEHVSDLPGWQEGAVLSAQRVVRTLAARARPG